MQRAHAVHDGGVQLLVGAGLDHARSSSRAASAPSSTAASDGPGQCHAPMGGRANVAATQPLPAHAPQPGGFWRRLCQSNNTLREETAWPPRSTPPWPRSASPAPPRSRSPVSDIDGVLRGKYLHKDKFEGAADQAASASATWSSAGTAPTSRTTTPRSRAGSTAFPTRWRGSTWTPTRSVPWDGGVDFFLGEFINADGTPLRRLPAPDPEAGAGARRKARLPGDDRHGVRVVQLPARRRRAGPPRRASARKR